MGLPHSEIRGSQPSYRLLSAYRRFSRPSSPLNAKASITCPFSLGHAYLTPAGGRCMPRWTLRIQQSVTRRTTHAHRRLNTRDRFSVQFNTCTASRSSSRPKPGRRTCLGCTTNTSLVKDAQTLMRMGIGNGTEVPVGVKGVERLECRNFSRFHYRKLRYSALKRARAHQRCARAGFA